MTQAADSQVFLSRPLVYVAGPYTNPDPIQNTHTTIKIANDLIDEAVVTPVIPHLTLLWHMVSPRPLEFWYAYDLAMLVRCDAVYRLPGASTGADAETLFAKDREIPVFTEKEALYRWAVDRNG